MRKVILHYHLFKNAGTSLDAAFKENFSEEKGEWVTKEFPNQPAANREQVRQWILDNPQAKCFSSHTALLPVPEFDDIEVFPVIFVRHPIDRIASAYSFEKKQTSSTFGSVLAKNTSLRGYIETRLSLPHDRQCRNFHTHRFSTMFSGNDKSELSKALTALDYLPFIGVVEKFADSILNLEMQLKEFGFENIKLSILKMNTSRVTEGLEEKLVKINKEIGKETYKKLEDANRDDISFIDAVNDYEF